MRRPFEFFRPTLSQEQVRAFGELANTLIFLEPTDILLGPETISEISQLIQKDFLVLLARCKEETGHIIRDLEKKMDDPNAANSPEPKQAITRDTATDYLERKMKTEMNFFALCYFSANVTTDEYGAAGFAPALTRLHPKTDSSGFHANCAGKAIMEGSMYRMRYSEKEVYMAITPDHPSILLLSNGTFKIHQTILTTVKGYVRAHGDIFEYRPSALDGSYSPISLIVDFDRAVLYEILENFEFLRQVSLGTVAGFLPKSRAECERMAKEYATVLQAADWKKIQNILFPDIAEYIGNHRHEWDHSVMFMKKLRRLYHVKELIRESFGKAREAAYPNEMDYERADRESLQRMKANKERVRMFIDHSAEFPKTADPAMVTFLRTFKEHVTNEVPEENRADCFHYLISKVFDTEPFA